MMELIDAIGLSLVQQILLLASISICLAAGVFLGWKAGGARAGRGMDQIRFSLQQAQQENEALKTKEEMLYSDVQLGLAEVERLSGERSTFEERSKQLEARLESAAKSEDSPLAQRLESLIESMKSKSADDGDADSPGGDGRALNEFMAHISSQFSELQDQMQQISSVREGQQSSIEKVLENLSAASTAQSISGGRLGGAPTVLEGMQTPQADWSSSILERLFAMSGLSDAKFCERLSGDENSQYAEWVVHLPGDKSLFVDGACPMEHWPRFINLPEGDAKDAAGADFLAAVKKRIQYISEREFPEQANIGEVEFSFLFIPPDVAWMYLLHQAPDLVQEAQKKRITLVSASNLLLSLKLVEHLWSVELENQNSEKIVDRAHRMYKKWVAFAQEMHRLGGSLQKASGEYDKAMQRLSTGRGNLVRQAEELIGLGVARPPGKLPESLAAGMLGDEEEEGLGEEVDMDEGVQSRAS